MPLSNSFSNSTAKANTIGLETLVNANTAERVGDALNTIIGESYAISKEVDSGFSFSSGFLRRGAPIEVQPANVNKWIPLDFSSLAQQTVDLPWWPGAADPNGIDLFGGSALPSDVTRIFDFTQTWDSSTYSDIEDADILVDPNPSYETPVDDQRVGTFRFDELPTGTTNDIRIDFYITPQIANTTLELALWFQPKLSVDGANDGDAFALTSTPVFLGTGTAGKQYLSRQNISMYIASSSDQFAYALPVFKSDNPVIIEPISCLIKNNR